MLVFFLHKREETRTWETLVATAAVCSAERPSRAADLMVKMHCQPRVLGRWGALLGRWGALLPVADAAAGDVSPVPRARALRLVPPPRRLDALTPPRPRRDDWRFPAPASGSPLSVACPSATTDSVASAADLRRREGPAPLTMAATGGSEPQVVGERAACAV